MADALALRGDEGRDKLRKAAGRSKYPLYPQISEWGNLPGWRPGVPVQTGKRTRRTETSKYPEEEKTKVIPGVVAIEMGIAQTGNV